MSKIKLATLSIVTCLAGFQVGCTDREVGAAVAGVFVGAMLESASHNPPPPRRPRTYRGGGQRVCHVQQEWTCQRDPYSGRERCSYLEVDSCGGAYYRPMSLQPKTYTLDPADVAATFDLSVDSAKLLTSALTTALNAPDDLTAKIAFQSIGLDLSTFRKVDGNFQVTPDMVNSVAAALNQKPEKTAAMLETLVNTARSQQAEANAGVSI